MSVAVDTTSHKSSLRKSCPGSGNPDDENRSPVQVRPNAPWVLGEGQFSKCADNCSVCRCKGMEPLHAEEDPCNQVGLTTRTGQS